MLRINYTNPLTRQYQYEYAMYKIMSDRFAGVECRSLAIDQLRLYYTDLVKESRNANDKVNYSHAKQETLDSEVQHMLERDVDGHIYFPQMNICKAEVRIRRDKNGCHGFTFTDGIYSFTLRMEAPDKKKRGRIVVRNRKIAGEKHEEVSESEQKSARLCA